MSPVARFVAALSLAPWTKCRCRFWAKTEIVCWFGYAACSFSLSQIVTIFLIISVACRRFENGLSPHFQTVSPVAQNPWKGHSNSTYGRELQNNIKFSCRNLCNGLSLRNVCYSRSQLVNRLLKCMVHRWTNSERTNIERMLMDFVVCENGHVKVLKYSDWSACGNCCALFESLWQPLCLQRLLSHIKLPCS